ncbi:lipopolysaccharide export system permease protein [Lishizhenia tianjinensis]|uniref:Lipopolysaccharide export system permease protein n=1 Tax=Lishizhenia tianjinensis TaxID=477690 RepID=A0A1I7BKA6_9FLAO|nr:LptF/LptG family permease [Lishizhenia tianjinensis]SFT87541.1 lipopolysaccharide export system permease protein [Lishizhenia tianjinensis]
MLKKIDRYIIKKYLVTFFFMLGVIMILSVVFDLSERLSEFISNKAPVSEILFDYYLNFVLYYGNLFSPLIIFLSVIWFTARMAQDSEIIPIINSGRPFRRLLRPYMISATVLMLFSLVLNHLVLPFANEKRLAFEEGYYRNARYVSDYHAQFPGNKIVYFKSYYGEQNSANGFTLEQRDENNEVVSILRAKKATNSDTSNLWVFRDYFIRKVGSPNDYIEEGAKLDTVLPFFLSEMAQRESVVMTMGYNEIQDFIQSEKDKGSPNIVAYEIDFYKRTSLPFATYVLTLLGLAVSTEKKRGGIGVSIAIGLGLTFVYIFCMQVTSVAATNVGFPSLLAVWTPNIIFTFIGIYMYHKAPK